MIRVTRDFERDPYNHPRTPSRHSGGQIDAGETSEPAGTRHRAIVLHAESLLLEDLRKLWARPRDRDGVEVPQGAGEFTVALGGREAPADRLRASGWQVLDGPAVTLTPNLYQSFIADSGAEISPAKEIYVAMRTGWFS